MGTRLVFDGRQVARQVHDSQVSAQRRPTMDQQVERLARQRGISQEAAEEAYAHLPNYDAIAAAGPDIPVGCWLVKDDGIYLMSNGDRSGQLPVVYARGYRGGRPGVWEASRDAMGGDDMCQFLPLDNLPPEISTDPRGRVIIEVEEDVLEVFVERVEVEGPGLGG